jgi:hypothetical protein
MEQWRASWLVAYYTTNTRRPVRFDIDNIEAFYTAKKAAEKGEGTLQHTCA